MKPGNVPQYVNRQSNHPPSILHNIPEAIHRRLSNISFDKQSFDSAIHLNKKPCRKVVTITRSNTTLNLQNQSTLEGEALYGSTHLIVPMLNEHWA